MNTGKRGERLAAWYLFFHGCRILARNWRCGRYEIDIVARERRTGILLFVEVKTRSSTDYGLPRDAVDRRKQLFLTRAAQGYLKQLGDPDAHTRFDVVEVYTKPLRIVHLPGAF
ncbi:MAG: YraN family protein [Clostridia bacterium]|nr:YraN family protein [Clostridia bacterium]